MLTFTAITSLLLNPKKIVITGGPSTGKTSVVQELEKRGFSCVHELIRSMTSEQRKEESAEQFVTNPILSVRDPKKFNQSLLNGRIDQYQRANASDADIVFFDRGIPDVHAYMNCFGQHYDKVFARPCHDFRYNRILLMPPWREIHVIDDERFETFDESVRIYDCLKNTYESFGYPISHIPKGSVKERTDFILDLLNLE